MNDIRMMDLVGQLGLNSDGEWLDRMEAAFAAVNWDEHERIVEEMEALPDRLGDWLRSIGNSSGREPTHLAELVASIAFVVLRRRALAKHIAFMDTP